MKFLNLLFVVGCALASSLHACDNRFFPWLKEPVERNFNPITNSYWGSFYADIKGFALHSSEASSGTDGDIGLFTIWGDYDLNKVAQALESAGFANPLKTEWRGQRIPFVMMGTQQGGGIRWSFIKDITPHFSVGMYGQLLKTQTRLALVFDQAHASIAADTAESRFELEQALLQANKELGLTHTWWNETSIGDIDLFLRFGNHWEYPRKFKAIDFYVRLGALAPFAARQNFCNPASVPIAGNGHIGIYGEIDVEFELKDDLKVGGQFYIIQRFARTGIFRIAHEDEPLNYGVIVGKFQVDPCMTFAANPYVLWQDMRDGFGLGLGYTVVTHPGDFWYDLRTDQTITARLDKARRLSSWTAEYLSVYLMYDFARAVTAYRFAPCVQAVIDAPVHFFGAQNVSQTVRVSLGLIFEL